MVISVEEFFAAKESKRKADQTFDMHELLDHISKTLNSLKTVGSFAYRNGVKADYEDIIYTVNFQLEKSGWQFKLAERTPSTGNFLHYFLTPLSTEF